MNNKQVYLYGILLINLFFCNSIFGEKQIWGELEYDQIKECSGIIASRKYLDIFWVHNDSGDKNRIFALNKSGNHVGQFYLKNCKARDWEDIAIGPGPMKHQDYIYVGDIGDNLSIKNIKSIYFFPEPDIVINKVPIIDTIRDVKTINFKYSDGNFDAETLLIDPITNDIIILTKREEKIRIYRLPYPRSITDINIAILDTVIDFYPDYGSANFRRISGGDISRDGKEILIKSYIDVFHFSRLDNQSISDAISENFPTLVEYEIEPQGEAICWHPNNFGYYTVSEENNDIPAMLHFYPKIEGCMDINANNYNPYSTVPNRSCQYSQK